MTMKPSTFLKESIMKFSKDELFDLRLAYKRMVKDLGDQDEKVVELANKALVKIQKRLEVMKQETEIDLGLVETSVQQIVEAPIESATRELHKAFDLMNETFFGGSLPKVALTIQTRGKRLAYGWFTPWEAWSDSANEVKLHEINISAESLNRPIEEVMRTLLHEMVHLHCHINGIQDTSRGGTFHNKNFKRESEAHGFFYDEPADKKYGWSFSKLTSETISIIQGYPLDLSAFLVARSVEVADKKKSNSFKWTCPCCKLTLRTSKKEHKVGESKTPKPISLICGICSDPDEGEIIYMEMEELEGDDDQ